MTIASLVLKNVTLHGYLDPSWIRPAPLYRVVSAFGLLAFFTACNLQDTPDNGQSGEKRQAFEVEDAEAELWRISAELERVIKVWHTLKVEDLKAELSRIKEGLERIIEGRDTLKVEDLEQLEVVRESLERMEAVLKALEHDEALEHDFGPAPYEVRPLYEARPTFPGQRRHTDGVAPVPLE